MHPFLEAAACPLPLGNGGKILLGHGSGGKLTSELIDALFLPIFGKPSGISHDGAFLSAGDCRLAFTTDSFVVKPLFFPGGNIGNLAVNGTVNDLAVCGALPKWLSCGFILEEGLDIEALAEICRSMRRAADAAGVRLVTGDTKVVEKGKGDGLYINTTGIGIIEGEPLKPENIAPGDLIIVNGPLGKHGMAILALREGLAFESIIESDTQELSTLTQALLPSGGISCMRDITRGGLATALVEIAEARRVTIEIDEALLPLDHSVRGACELLGLDPLYIACEGRLAAFVKNTHAAEVLRLMAANNHSPQVIGEVVSEGGGVAAAKTFIGTKRLLHRLPGDQLPRIC